MFSMFDLFVKNKLNVCLSKSYKAHSTEQHPPPPPCPDIQFGIRIRRIENCLHFNQERIQPEASSLSRNVYLRTLVDIKVIYSDPRVRMRWLVLLPAGVVRLVPPLGVVPGQQPHPDQAEHGRAPHHARHHPHQRAAHRPRRTSGRHRRCNLGTKIFGHSQNNIFETNFDVGRVRPEHDAAALHPPLPLPRLIARHLAAAPRPAAAPPRAVLGHAHAGQLLAAPRAAHLSTG